MTWAGWQLLGWAGGQQEQFLPKTPRPRLAFSLLLSAFGIPALSPRPRARAGRGAPIPRNPPRPKTRLDPGIRPILKPAPTPHRIRLDPPGPGRENPRPPEPAREEAPAPRTHPRKGLVPPNLPREGFPPPPEPIPRKIIRLFWQQRTEVRSHGGATIPPEERYATVRDELLRNSASFPLLSAVIALVGASRCVPPSGVAKNSPIFFSGGGLSRTARGGEGGCGVGGLPRTAWEDCGKMTGRRLGSGAADRRRAAAGKRRGS